MAALADLWGFASKSSAARVVEVLLAEGFLERAPGRRLRPGPAFASPAGPDWGDLVDEAVSQWVRSYGEDPGRGYELTSRILRLAWAIQAGIERNSALEGLTAGEVMVLDALYRVGPPYQATPTALKNYFLISLAGVGKRVEHLHRMGLVDRVRDPHDRRSLLVQLNSKGRAALQRLVEVDRVAPHIAWSNRLSAADQAMLSRLLRAAQHEIEAPFEAGGADRADGD